MSRDKMLSDALRQVCENENEKLINSLDVSSDVHFSDDYEMKIADIMERATEEKHIKCITIAKHIATAVAVFAVIGSAVLLNMQIKTKSPDYKAINSLERSQFSINTYEDREFITSNGLGEKMLNEYVIVELPDGYSYENIQKSKDQCVVNYSNGTDRIILEQTAARIFAASHTMDKYERSFYIDKDENEYIVYTDKTNGSVEIIWMKDGNVMRIMCNLDVTHAVDLCKSTKKK